MGLILYTTIATVLFYTPGTYGGVMSSSVSSPSTGVHCKSCSSKFTSVFDDVTSMPFCADDSAVEFNGTFSQSSDLEDCQLCVMAKGTLAPTFTNTILGQDVAADVDFTPSAIIRGCYKGDEADAVSQLLTEDSKSLDFNRISIPAQFKTLVGVFTKTPELTVCNSEHCNN